MLLFILIEPTQLFKDAFVDLTLPNGLVIDRLSDETTVSCAATGMVAYSKSILIKEKQLPLSEIEVIKKGYYNTINTNPDKNKGWLYHFTYPNGRPKEYSEVSTVDTALFFLSYLNVAKIIEDKQFENDILSSISKIDKSLVMKDNYFIHGFIWNNDERVFLTEKWDDYNEGLLIYRLFEIEFTPILDQVDLPLFVYYYPLCFYKDQTYIDHLIEAVKYQKDRYGYCGITACDGPDGYQVGDPDIVSPLSLFAASRYSEIAKQELSQYELIPSLSKSTAWESKDKVAIDYASAFLCIVSMEDTILKLP